MRIERVVATVLDDVHLDDPYPDGLRERERQRDEVQRRLGMTFRVEGEEEDRLFPVDLVPRVVAAEDWAFLREGLAQRVRALAAFVRDAYGDRAAVRDGVVQRRPDAFPTIDEEP